ncbi:hypothetical protein H0H87_006467 [Tephrocybe sp. NHM501043]|nr:hypothetical protein H0H87_006467 [Tephrocybe sp. NHM501043]
MSAAFSLLTAFSSSRRGGNPAAVVFTDMSLPCETLMDVAENFNQPVTSFVSSLSFPCDKPRAIGFNIRWYSASRQDIALCGHGALTAAKAIFERDDVPDDIEVVEFHTRSAGIVRARKCQEGFIEIEVPTARTSEVSPEDFVRISAIFNRACGRELVVKHIARGIQDFHGYLMVILDESENIKDLQVNTPLLCEAGSRINIITSASSKGQEQFVSRMFAPGLVPGDEDAVCGSAHCVMVPYWYTHFGIASGQEIRARQVSARGGDLKLVWEQETSSIKLAGEVVVLGRGEINIT